MRNRKQQETASFAAPKTTTVRFVVPFFAALTVAAIVDVVLVVAIFEKITVGGVVTAICKVMLLSQYSLRCKGGCIATISHVVWETHGN